MANIITTIRNWFSPVVRFNGGYLEHNDTVTGISKTDVAFSTSSMSITPIQGEVSVRKYFKPISNQYSVGSCVANATADACEAEQVRSRNVSPSDVYDISRLFIYWNARNNENPPAGGVDKGTYIALAFDAIKRYGVPPETTWPYDTTKALVRPSPLAYAKAYAVKINKYYSINSSGDDRVADVIRALSSGRSVVFGTKLNEPFRSIKSRQIIGPPSGGYIGGHAMVITGWSDAQKCFEVRNSWGEDWGDQGYVYFTPEYIKASITHDLFVATL